LLVSNSFLLFPRYKPNKPAQTGLVWGSTIIFHESSLH